MIKGLDHIAVAVPDLERAIRRFADDFGCQYQGTETVVAAKTTTAFFPVSSTSIELVHPLDGDGPIAKYLEERPGGLHHLCFRSDDIRADMAALKEKGYEFLHAEAQPGAHGCKVAFIHPRSCGGVLIEINQPPPDSDESDQ